MVPSELLALDFLTGLGAASSVVPASSAGFFALGFLISLATATAPSATAPTVCALMTDPAEVDLSVSVPMADNLAISSRAALAASLAIWVAASIELLTMEAGSALSGKTGVSLVAFVFLDLGTAVASGLALGSATIVAVLLGFFLVGGVVGAAGSVAAAAIKKVRANKFIIV